MFSIPSPAPGPMPAHDQPCSCSRGPNVEHGKWYGVRSYLHLFYKDCTGASPADDMDEPPVSHGLGGWPSLVWKVKVTWSRVTRPVWVPHLGRSGPIPGFPPKFSSPGLLHTPFPPIWISWDPLWLPS
uniref:NRSN2 n=1 Tax=Pelusios castaneus TaxID=367368 RepID=A0A8C8R599_9SAUR